jgi:hypothetical protein
LNITIFNPAPLGETLVKWGDYPFGRALQRGLEALGAKVTQRYWPQWTQDPEADVHLVLRGKRAFPQAHGRPAILSMISHPASVSEAELSAYDFVLLGSKRHMAMLGGLVRTGEFAVARQCTEFTEFTPAHPTSGDSAEDRHGVIFVANSRGVRRPILRWALDLGVPVEIYGRHWKTFVLSELVRSEHVENERLPSLYRKSRLTLNDHWTDMQYFGYISNRIFDCLASGLPVMTDEFAELHEVFGASLLYVRDRASLLEAHERYLREYSAVKAATDDCWQRIGPDHTFDARARLIADIAQRLRAAGRSGTRDTSKRLVSGQSELAGLLAGSTGGRVLHVMPSCHLDSAGSLDDRVGYVTAGLGCGPWTVAIDEHLSAFPSLSFSVIIVDDISGCELADGVDTRVFMEAITRCLEQKGRMLVHANSSLVRQGRPCWTSCPYENASENYREYRGDRVEFEP